MVLENGCEDAAGGCDEDGGEHQIVEVLFAVDFGLGVQDFLAFEVQSDHISDHRVVVILVLEALSDGATDVCEFVLLNTNRGSGEGLRFNCIGGNIYDDVCGSGCGCGCCCSRSSRCIGGHIGCTAHFLE